jgi:hypothetical protein
MRYIPEAVAADWRLFEISRNGRLPVSAAYRKVNDEQLVNLFSSLSILRAAGCPPDATKGNPVLEHVGTHVLRTSKRRIKIMELKAKPGPWRLYFFVRDEQKREIVFLLAVSKKKNKRNSEDVKRCGPILDKYDDGYYEITPIFIPTRY